MEPKKETYSSISGRSGLGNTLNIRPGQSGHQGDELATSRWIKMQLRHDSNILHNLKVMCARGDSKVEWSIAPSAQTRPVSWIISDSLLYRKTTYTWLNRTWDSLQAIIRRTWQLFKFSLFILFYRAVPNTSPWIVSGLTLMPICLNRRE